MSSPIILSQSMVNRALGDPKFFGVVPEFNSLKNRQKVRKPVKGKGCGGCKQKTVHQNMFKEFVAATLSLNPNAAGRLKKYLGVDQLMINTQDTKTYKVDVRIV